MKKGGRVPWSVTAICETYKISCLMEKHLAKGDSANHSKGPVIPFGSWQSITLFLLKICRDCTNSASKSCHENSLDMRCTRSAAKDTGRLHQFGPKVLPGIFLGCALHAGRIWKGDILVGDIEEWE